MGEWVWPAYVAVIGGVALFGFFVGPILAIQYRMYGRFTSWRFVGAAMIALYGVALVAYTLLPLPDPAQLQCAAGSQSLQPIPFNFLADIHRETAGLGPLQILTSRVTLQVVFNVLLFIPWGVIARRYLAWSIPTSVITGAMASLFIEATQYTGLWGLYNCSYRLADADDLITNTLGALIGALIAPLVLRFMPQRRTLVGARHDSRPVTSGRRLLGMLIDLALLHLLGSLLVITTSVALLVLGLQPPKNGSLILPVLNYLVPGLLVFYLPALLSSGASLGQRAVWLQPSWRTSAGPTTGASPGTSVGQPELGIRLLRASITGGLYAALLFLGEILHAPLISFLTAPLLIAGGIAVLFTRQRGLSALLTKAEITDSRAVAVPGTSTATTDRQTGE